jgi:hypothetical protein
MPRRYSEPTVLTRSLQGGASPSSGFRIVLVQGEDAVNIIQQNDGRCTGGRRARSVSNETITGTLTHSQPLETPGSVSAAGVGTTTYQ